VSALEQLVTDDIVEFGYCDLAPISDRRFQVIRRDERDFGDSVEVSWLIRTQTTLLQLQPGLNQNAGDLIVKSALERPQVEAVFDMRAFVTVFHEGFTPHIPLARGAGGLAGEFADWLDVEGYTQNVDARPGRARVAPGGSWVDYDLYMLQGRSCPGRTVEIEVYRNETDVFLCRALPDHVIERIWPAGGT